MRLWFLFLMCQKQMDFLAHRSGWTLLLGGLRPFPAVVNRLRSYTDFNP